MSESNIMHEATARVYHTWNSGLPISAGQLIRAWGEAPDPESDIPPGWWVDRLRETCPGTKAVNLVHLYRAATTTEIDNGFVGMQWTTERADAEAEARAQLRVLVETVVSPAAILAVIGTEAGGTVLVNPWQVKTIYLSEDVRDDKLATAPKPARNLLSTNVAGLGTPATLSTAPARPVVGKGLTARLSANAQTKRVL
ncbi:hypothetical protein AALF15_12955 [Corynebacteriaceae bacterium 7-707]